MRWNTYVALALAPAVVAAEAMPLVALAVAVMVPAANVMSVAALARHGSAGRAGPAAFARAVATNPLILACLAGHRAQPVRARPARCWLRSLWRSWAGRRWRSACSPSAPGCGRRWSADCGHRWR